MRTVTPADRARGLRVLAEASAAKWRDIVGAVESLVAAGAPRRALLVALSPDLAPTRAFDAIRDWAGDSRRSPKTGILVLSGPVGVGKTVAAARYALKTRAVWANAPDLGMEDYARAARMVERLIAAPAVVIDEIGGPGATGQAGIARLSNVIVQRHAAGRPVVATTNKDFDELAEVFDDCEARTSRIADRIREGGAYVECRRDRSFRVDGGAGPDDRNNPHRIATRGAHLVGLLDAGETDGAVLDELQDLLCCSDEDVERASNMAGLTPAVKGQIEALLEKVRPENKRAPATCGLGHGQQSQQAYGTLEAIS